MAALGSSWQACPVAKPATAQRADPPHECINVPMRAVCMNIIGGRPMHLLHWCDAATGMQVIGS